MRLPNDNSAQFTLTYKTGETPLPVERGQRSQQQINGANGGAGGGTSGGGNTSNNNANNGAPFGGGGGGGYQQMHLRKLEANNGSSVLTGHDLPSAGKQPLLTLSANKPYKQANHAKKTFCSPSIVEQRNIESRRTNIESNQITPLSEQGSKSAGSGGFKRISTLSNDCSELRNINRRNRSNSKSSYQSSENGLPSESENESSLFMSRFSDEQNFDSFFASEQPKSRKAALSKLSTSIDSVYTQEKKENNLGDKEKPGNEEWMAEGFKKSNVDRNQTKKTSAVSSVLQAPKNSKESQAPSYLMSTATLVQYSKNKDENKNSNGNKSQVKVDSENSGSAVSTPDEHDLDDVVWCRPKALSLQLNGSNSRGDVKMMSANKTSNSSPSGKDREHFGKKTHFSNSLTELRNLQAKAPGQDNQDSTTTQAGLELTGNGSRQTNKDKSFHKQHSLSTEILGPKSGNLRRAVSRDMQFEPAETDDANNNTNNNNNINKSPKRFHAVTKLNKRDNSIFRNASLSSDQDTDGSEHRSASPDLLAEGFKRSKVNRDLTKKSGSVSTMNENNSAKKSQPPEFLMTSSVKNLNLMDPNANNSEEKDFRRRSKRPVVNQSDTGDKSQRRNSLFW
ncbi:uncharacterized protein LOC142340527 isoform X2 [Convolutriloba macropyga]|uniref:uncharacterized protein LOC142340527 isoform X2 n=1 Tax=Convolutriloba macropyga TaxID=536237 RepID=UPI003F51E05B